MFIHRPFPDNKRPQITLFSSNLQDHSLYIVNIGDVTHAVKVQPPVSRFDRVHKPLHEMTANHGRYIYTPNSNPRVCIPLFSLWLQDFHCTLMQLNFAMKNFPINSDPRMEEGM